MAYRFKIHLESGTMDSVIPQDYFHAFLVRDPKYTVPSYFKMTLNMGIDMLAKARAGQHELLPKLPVISLSVSVSVSLMNRRSRCGVRPVSHHRQHVDKKKVLMQKGTEDTECCVCVYMCVSLCVSLCVSVYMYLRAL